VDEEIRLRQERVDSNAFPHGPKRYVTFRFDNSLLSEKFKLSVNLKLIDSISPVYSAIFYDIAKKYGLDEERLKEATLELIEERVAKLIDLSSKSNSHIKSLDGASKKALQAMKEKDEALLKESISETEALRREIEKLKESVYKDSLTQTYNREWLNANCLDDDGCFKSAYTLALVDLNYFKEINDNLGHIAGDKVLKYISSHLKSLGAPVVRYGGDEFLLLFDSPDDARKIDECRETVIKKKLKYNDHTFAVSFSCGTYERTQICTGTKRG